MHYRTLGRTGLEVSEIGLGGAVFAGTSHGPFDETEAIDAIRTPRSKQASTILTPPATTDRAKRLSGGH